MGIITGRLTSLGQITNLAFSLSGKQKLASLEMRTEREREIIIEPNMVFHSYQINYKREPKRLWVYFHVKGLGCIYRGTLCSRVRCSHITVGPYGAFPPCPGVQCFHAWNHCSKGSCSFMGDGKDLSDHTLWLLIRRNKTPGQGWAVGFIANICLASCRNSTGLKWTDPLMSKEGASRRNSCALHLSDRKQRSYFRVFNNKRP